ncbi:AsmA-like C-terminal region-containing protein [Rhodopirellula sp. MGV]|uniref:AsmA-like C-terminal region-containing protein n=1 Tax=Rhodopirellula sp. MGV TaxID=2023130 RepID=UPI000B97425B|nr:AsmA-like C-terminal region-containing protein [Rhodopirellula sp. MGV]OYP37722.1 hypothetical protein CGZ80_04360 [Rhodopirellula sp. MGV]PNY37159.1 hypothetical protein C2E31_09215 [Rhodopirellula baltica]
MCNFFQVRLTILAAALLATGLLGSSKSCLAQAPNYRYWTTDWSFEDIEVGKLASRLERLGIEIPVAVDGNVTVKFEVSVPLNALRTGKAYKIHGTVSGQNVRSDQLIFDSLRAVLDFRDGKLTLQELDAKQGQGKIAGNASMELIPRGNFAGNLTLSELKTDAVFDLLEKFGGDWAKAWSIATIDGQVNVKGRATDLNAPLKWDITGKVAAKNVQYGPKLNFDVSVPSIQVKQQRVDIGGAVVESKSTPPFKAELAGSMDLANAPKVDLRFTADDFPAGSFTELIDGKIDLQGKVQGTISGKPNDNPLQIDAAIASPRLRLAGLDLGRIEHDVVLAPNEVRLTPREPIGDSDDSVVLRSLKADYAIDDNAFRLTALDAKVFDGSVTGDVTLSTDSFGSHQFDIDWESLAPKLSVQLPIASRPTVLAATTSGKVKWQVPADKLDQPFAHRGNAIVQISQLSAGGEPIGQLMAEARIDGQQLEAAVDGEVLGGRVAIHSTSAATPQASWSELLQRVVIDQFTVKDLSIEQASVLGGQRAGLYSGQLDLTANELSLSDSGQPITAEIVLKAVRVANTELIPNLTTLVAIHPDRLAIDSIQGVYAGGRLAGQGTWSTGAGRRTLQLRLTRADGSRMLLPISPDASTWLAGTVSGQVSVTGLGSGPLDKLRITGNAMVDDASTFNLPVGDAHSSLVVTFDSKNLRWTADFPSVKSKLAGGLVSGKLSLSSPASNRGSIDMDSRWRIAHVDFERLLNTYVGTATIGQGDVTGDLTLSGRRIVDARSLRGDFQFRLGGTDASAVPGLSTAGVLLGASSLVGTRFSEGIAVGRIASGAIHLDEVAMLSDRVAVRADGRVGLLDTRMDIGMVLSTGNFQGQDFLVNLVGLSDLLVASPIGQVNRILSDRTFVFDISGTAKTPIVRLLPGESFRATAKRFALQELITISTANSLFSN